MKKISFFLNCAASAMFAIALTACNATEDNPTGFDPSLKTIQSGDTLSTFVAKALTNDVILEIPAGVDTVYTGEITMAAGQKLTIVGDSINPPVIVPTASIILSNAFTVKNVVFDCGKAEKANHLFLMSSTPDEDLKVESGQYVIKDPVVIDNVTVKDIKKAFFFDNNMTYFFETFTINNSIVGYKDQGNVVLNFNASMVKDFTLTNSTFYSLTKTDKNFIGMNGSKRPWQITGYDGVKAEAIISNNTFYQMANKKVFFNMNQLKGQANYTFDVENNIFYDTANKKVYEKWFGNTGNANKQLTAVNNVYLYDGANVVETSYTTDPGVNIDPKFKAPEEGNFMPTEKFFLFHKPAIGDPRWDPLVRN